MRQDLMCKLAEFMVAAEHPHADLARRYLSVVRRERVLRAGVERGRTSGRMLNPLSEIDFRLPLSVAGLKSITVCRGLGMRMRGVPIATEYDEKGRHRGTPLDELQRDLWEATGHAYTDEQVLGFYERWVKGPAVPRAKYARIPGCLNRVAVQLNWLGEQLLKAASAAPTAEGRGNGDQSA